MSTRESDLLAAWARTCRRRGGDRAIVEAAGGRACTFQEIEQGSMALLAALAPEPSGLAGRAVVFAGANGIRWFELFLALRRAGAVVVPLDPAEPPAARERIARQLRAAYWYDGDRLVPLPGARRFRDPATCLIKLTSGSTGAPRPLVFTDAQMLADARQVTGTMGITSRDINYGVIPLGHSYGLGNLAIPLLAGGVPLVCGSVPLPHVLAEDFRRWRPTVLPSVPAVFRVLLEAEVDLNAFASLRLAISAGAPLAPALARAFAARFGRRIHSFYGSSETGGIAYDRSGAAALEGGVGRAMRGVTITPQRGGRIRVCSAAVFTLGNPGCRDGRGCWSPPDRVAIDPKGGLVLLGRRGRVVKVGGRRVNLGEIVAALRRLPGVDDAWVGVIAGREPAIVAAVASRRSAEELRRDFLADTAAWKLPKRWLVLPALPVNGRGKVDTRALQAVLTKARTETTRGPS